MDKEVLFTSCVGNRCRTNISWCRCRGLIPTWSNTVWLQPVNIRVTLTPFTWKSSIENVRFIQTWRHQTNYLYSRRLSHLQSLYRNHFDCNRFSLDSGIGTTFENASISYRLRSVSLKNLNFCSSYYTTFIRPPFRYSASFLSNTSVVLRFRPFMPPAMRIFVKLCSLTSQVSLFAVYVWALMKSRL